MVEDEKTSKGKMEAKRSTVSLKEFIQRMLLYSGRYNFIEMFLLQGVDGKVQDLVEWLMSKPVSVIQFISWLKVHCWLNI
jgi:hypothetical protein